MADGVGGFDVCGTALRYVLAAEKLPYAVEVFAWGHGFGRWFADLTDTANRDEKARLLAEMPGNTRQSGPTIRFSSWPNREARVLWSRLSNYLTRCKWSKQ